MSVTNTFVSVFIDRPKGWWLPEYVPPPPARPCRCEIEPAVFGHTSCALGPPPPMTNAESVAAARLAEPPIVVS